MPPVTNSNKRKTAAPATKAARITARKKIGTLSHHLIKPKTHGRYVASFQEFLDFHQMHAQFKIMDYYEEFDRNRKDKERGLLCGGCSSVLSPTFEALLKLQLRAFKSLEPA